MRSPISLLLVVASVLLVGGCGFGGGSRLDDQSRKPILRAATADVERLLSYDAATLDRDRSEVGEVSTREFARTFGALLSGEAGKAIEAQTAVSTASVVDAGTVNFDADEPQVLLYVRQTTTSNKLAAPRLDLSAVTVDLRMVDGHWRISGIEKVAPARASSNGN